MQKVKVDGDFDITFVIILLNSVPNFSSMRIFAIQKSIYNSTITPQLYLFQNVMLHCQEGDNFKCLQISKFFVAMDPNIENNPKLSNELELWLKMVDSLAHVITASTSLLRMIHSDSGNASPRKHKKKSNSVPLQQQEKRLDIEPKLVPYYQHPFDNISNKFKNCPQGKSIDFLDEEYRKAKQAIFKRYGPQSKITTLYTRNMANVDFIDDKINENLYKISEKSSERAINLFSNEKLAEFYRINKRNSTENYYATCETI